MPPPPIELLLKSSKSDLEEEDLTVPKKALKKKKEEIRLKVSYPEREPSGFKILRVRAPHSAGVLMRLLNAYLRRRFVNKRLSQQAFNSKIRAPHSTGVLIN